MASLFLATFLDPETFGDDAVAEQDQTFSRRGPKSKEDRVRTIIGSFVSLFNKIRWDILYGTCVTTRRLSEMHMSPAGSITGLSGGNFSHLGDFPATSGSIFSDRTSQHDQRIALLDTMCVLSRIPAHSWCTRTDISRPGCNSSKSLSLT